MIKLDRVYFAGLTKKGLRRGDWRYLTEQEVNMLQMCIRDSYCSNIMGTFAFIIGIFGIVYAANIMENMITKEDVYKRQVSIYRGRMKFAWL